MVKSFGLREVAYFRKRGNDNGWETCHGWCQFYGDNHRSRIPMDLMYMSMRIQNPNINREFDIVIELKIIMHNQLVYWNTSINLKNYSLLYHSILFQNINVFRNTMKLTTVDGQGKTLLVQLWCRKWDKNSRDCDYKAFHDAFVVWIFRALGV